jgi:hypothetical protein
VEQALKTIESWNPSLRTDDDEAAVTALRAALEQPEQEPVAWMVTDKDGRHFIFRINKPVISEGETLAPLYTHPPRREWQGLTEEQVKEVVHNTVEKVTVSESILFRAVARAIEAKLKERNHE